MGLMIWKMDIGSWMFVIASFGALCLKAGSK